MPGTKRKAEPMKIIKPAMQLFASEGFSKVTLEDIAKASGYTADEIRPLFSTKEEVLISAYRIGQKKMEERFRTMQTGDFKSHMETMFDSLLDGLMPFGPQVHLSLIRQATQDNTLAEIIRRTSRNVNFGIKAYLLQMVSLTIIDEVEGAEKVNENMVTTFIEGMASMLEGKKLPAIKKAWVSNASRMLKPSSKTTVATPF